MTYLHQYDLGPPMSAADMETQLRHARGSDMLRAILQHMRDKAAEIDLAGRQPPADCLHPGDYRAYHSGGVDAIEEVFRKLHEVSESGLPEDEEAEGDA